MPDNLRAQFSRVYPMKRLSIIIVCLVTISIYSCKKIDHKPVPLPGTTWQEVKEEGLALFSSTTIRITFVDGNNFQLYRISFTDGIDLQDSCFFKEQQEYVMGKYELNSGELFLTGQYANMDFTAHQPTCKGRVQFSEHYNYSFVNGWLILNSNRPVEQQLTLRRD